MPELLIELFSEEIPARMQAGAAASLARLVGEALAPLAPAGIETFHGPRRIAMAATVTAEVQAASSVERGPRVSAPPQALEGFLRKHGATRDQLADENGHWVLTRSSPATPAGEMVAAAMPGLLRRFPWPKSMRWGNGSGFTWVRPLRRITCVLDGAVVPFSLAGNADDGHGLASGNETEGHRFHAPGAFAVVRKEDWETGLRSRYVLPRFRERYQKIWDGLDVAATAEGLSVVDDPSLMDEVANLVEWPAVLLGNIDPDFMDLPPEVMQVSMRVNQRYFALRTPDGTAAPRFAFVANIDAKDGGLAIIAGNERVLRARFSDARHFWDLDRRTPLADRLKALDGITFHAKLGTQAARVNRIEAIARRIAPLVGANPAVAARAALLAKADLTTGMVGEFPELQGVMGGYYATFSGESEAVSNAIRDHYSPRGPNDAAPTDPTTIAVAIADKTDQLISFFQVGEIPTGSRDPLGLRRAALGIIRMIRENQLHLPLDLLFSGVTSKTKAILEGFLFERLCMQVQDDPFMRVDTLLAVHATTRPIDLNRLPNDADYLAIFLDDESGKDLIVSAKRVANILRVENRNDGPHQGPPDRTLMTQPAELHLAETVEDTFVAAARAIQRDVYSDALHVLAELRPSLDAFFNQVTVNDPDPALRRNRLKLLSRVDAAMRLAADFSKIEG